MNHTALIGDLVGSKAIEPTERRRVQRGLNALFQGHMPGTSAGIASQPTITLGDEFQALFSATERPSVIRTFLTDIQDICRPTLVRFGLGVGALATDLAPVSIGMDGPCFHHARAALVASREHGLACVAHGSDQLTADMLSFLLSHLLDIRSRWSDAQREAVEAYLALPEGERTWSRVAQNLGRSASAITQRQQGAQWALVTALSGVVDRGLDRLERESNGASA